MALEPDNYFAKFEMERPALSLDAPVAVIRPAKLSDCHGCAELCQQREGGDLTLHMERFQREVTMNPGWLNRLVLVAEFNGAIVGYGRAVCFDPPPRSPKNVAPVGWYLGGVIVAGKYRRRGIGSELLRHRLSWISSRTAEAWYVVNAQNLASIALHAKFGFCEVTREFTMPGVSFRGGEGILFRANLT